MKAVNFQTIAGTTRYWWILLVVGILLVLGGFAYWFWPAEGYAVISMIFGWLMILAGVTQVCASAGVNQPRGWGWILASGIINMFIGFVMVRSLFLSEFIFPFILAFIFVFAGIVALAQAVKARKTSYWWINIVNGILLLIIGFMICDGGYRQDEMMVSFITAVGFVYWGFTVAMASLEMKPVKESE